ncbi:hypothetical protein HY310_01015 [Candidatus Microgenomates bacterium]|nr:hypothetical protein [Candidatus Microgenomates bacterium]
MPVRAEYGPDRNGKKALLVVVGGLVVAGAGQIAERLGVPLATPVFEAMYILGVLYLLR